MKKYIYSFIVAFVACFAFSSCSDVDIPAGVVSPKVENLTSQVEGRTVTLNWTLPADEQKSGVDIYRNNALLESLGLVNTAVLELQPGKSTCLYTLKMKYNDGRVSDGVSTSVTIDAEPSKVAILLPSNDASSLDDDESAAKEWFQNSYGDKGVVLTPADIKAMSKIDRAQYSMIWIQIDRVGLQHGWKQLPAEIVDADVIAKLKAFAQSGGNLFLTKHATQLSAAIGRIDESLAPGIFGSGEGGEGSDYWTTNAVIGSNCDPKYDHRSHAAFAGLEVLPANDSVDNYDHESYPLEGPGFREDHNCMWDLNAYDLPTKVPDGKNVVNAWEKLTTSIVLATWGHVTDYCCAGIVEYKPTTDYKGTVLCIGLNAYEFSQRGGNKFQANMERLTKNCIDYLAE